MAKVSSSVTAQLNKALSKAKESTQVRCRGFFTIQPELAKWILENLLHPNQRDQKERRIDQMAGDLLRGTWVDSHQGIAFDEEGWLIDGQNRLQSSVDSEKSIRLWIFDSLPESSRVVLDTHSPRTAKDAERLMTGKKLSLRYVATARKMMAGISDRFVTPSHAELRCFYNHHDEAIRFVIDTVGRIKKGIHGIATAGVFAVIARAWYSADKGRLAQFCIMLNSGKTDSLKTDEAVLTLRNELIAMNQNSASGTAAVQKQYQLTTEALVAFLAKKSLSKLKGTVTHEGFFLPGESDENQS